jgi:predicted alpha/beta hydrolase family esterase
MKQVILIHGLPSRDEYYESEWPSQSNAHWLPWVQREVLRKGIMCQALEMPHPYNPTYKDRCDVLDQMNINEDTILVGHSCGAGFLVRYFSEHKDLKPKKLILVAPWLDPEGYLKELNPETDFFDFKIDSDLSNRTHIDIMYSIDDEKYILESVERIKKEIPNIEEHIFSDKGHFTEPDLGTKEFPELVKIVFK